MKLVLDTEQTALQSTARELLTDRSPSAKVREIMAESQGYDPDLWSQLGSLGLVGVAVPDKFGGGGAGHVERSLVLEELGRSLAPTPFLASAVLAADALTVIGDEAAALELLPGLATGDMIGTVAVAESHSGLWDSDGGTTTATLLDGRWQLSGRKSPVLYGAQADVLLVYARTSEGPGWFAVDGTACGLTRTPLVSLDPTRSIAGLSFDATPARRLDGVQPRAALQTVADLAAIAVAAEQVGLMGRALNMAVDYAKIRVQFGRPIGSYQAVKHGCADMYCAWELASAVLRYAAWTADGNPTELGLAAALAQTYIGPACFQTASSMIQYHGGIGYTWEHDAHLFYKRAKSAQLLFGRPSLHRAHLADRLGM
jgi:alkylation response protein AidB-like acyl-CoA dehydrogenase